jgi:3-oxoacyl-[acyl-carrier protein] reductase
MMHASSSLTRKVALVTGGSRGIGKAIAIALAKEGADIALNYHKGEKEAQHVAVEIRDRGSRCTVIGADISQSSDVAKMKDVINNELGTVQLLINNAGISRPQLVQDITEKDWHELIDTNLKSAFLVTQAFLSDMRDLKWGRIVYLSSVAAQLGGVVGPHYAASKAGLIGLMHSYANLMAKEGITVNAIAPALIATEMVAKNVNARSDLIPIGRFGTVEEVVEVAVMLMKNGYITGQTINVNGGWYMS